MNRLKVGIPRALSYYQYFPMWHTFFNQLGVEVIVSAETNQKTLLAGSARLVGDTCLPVKAYIGHVLSLIDRCDFVFVPSVVTIRNKGYNCPKLTALPDVVRSVVPELGNKLITFHYDTLYNRRSFYIRVVALARRFSQDPINIFNAIFRANQANQEYRKIMNERHMTSPVAIEAQIEGVIKEPSNNSSRAVVGVIGHPYLMYDDFVSQNILKMLSTYDIQVVSPQMLPEATLSKTVRRIVVHNHWLTETEIIGAGHFFMNSDSIDGVLGLSSFCCGPDSMMMEIVNRTRQNKKPFMVLKLDEHTGYTGTMTRLEAFIDMIIRKRKASL